MGEQSRPPFDVAAWRYAMLPSALKQWLDAIDAERADRAARRAARRPPRRHPGERSARTLSSEYSIWVGMKSRCLNPNSTHWELYGGLGIRVCERWQLSYDDFLSDVGPRPSLAHSLHRIDPYGHYFPENVRWATWVEQNNPNNKRRHRIAFETAAMLSGGKRLALDD